MTMELTVNYAAEYGTGTDVTLDDVDAGDDIRELFFEAIRREDDDSDLVVGIEDIHGLFGEHFTPGEVEDILYRLEVFERYHDEDGDAALEAWVDVHGAHYARSFDADKVSFFHGSRSDYGRDYVESECSELPSIVHNNLDFEGIADDYEADYDVSFVNHGFGFFIVEMN